STLVRLAKEEEGVGISAGAHLAGMKSAMLMQNHGFLASINGIVSCAQLYKIPLLMLISYRGEFGERDPWQTEGGGVTEDLLRALRIPFAYLDHPDHVGARIRKAQTLAPSANKPVALLLCRDLMWEEPGSCGDSRRPRRSIRVSRTRSWSRSCAPWRRSCNRSGTGRISSTCSSPWGSHLRWGSASRSRARI